MAKPKRKRASFSRFLIAIEYPSGFRWTVESLFEVAHTPETIIASVRKYADEMEEALRRDVASPKTEMTVRNV